MKVGRYEVTGFLGRGGMAEVFKCSLSGIGGFDKTIVVKRMLPELIGDPQFVQMFLDEARLVARLSHPNIVQVFEVGEMEGIPFLAMEYVHGPTLRQVVRQVRLDRKQNLGHMVKIIAGIALALDYAHNAKDTKGDSLCIVHRDVSPHNIIVSTLGESKLLDFGVAKAAGRISKTKAGSLKGKFAYMAPEQTEGIVDFRSDIFSVGVCLYEACLMRRPFSGENEAEVLQAVIKGHYKKPREIVNAFPERLEEIITWAMNPDPDQRCPSARILHNALENFISRGEFPSEAETMQAWLRELFPDPSVFAPKAPPEGFGTGSQSVPGVAPQHTASASMPSISRTGISGMTSGQYTPSASVIIEKRSVLPWIIALVAVAGAAAVGSVLYMKSQNGTEPALAKSVSQGVGAQASVAKAQEARAKSYMDEITKMVASKKYSLALGLLTKLSAIELQDPALDIERSRLVEKTKITAYLAMAKMALETGDKVGAMEKAKRVLESDFQNVEARRLLVAARGSKAGAAPNPVVSDEERTKGKASTASSNARHSSRRVGKLSVRSNTPATIYVDDMPIGRTPLSSVKLRPGSHQIEARADGYEPAESSVTLRAGKSRSVTLTLKAIKKEPTPVKPAPPKAPPVAVAVVRPPAPAPKAVPKPLAVAPKAVAPKVEKKPAAPGKPRLPKLYTLRSRSEIAKVFKVVEKEIGNRGHVPASVYRNVTSPLAMKLYADFAPGSTVDVYPRGMYWIVVDRFAAGQRAKQIAGALIKAQASRTVRSYKHRVR